MVCQLPGAAWPVMTHTRLMRARMGSQRSTSASAASSSVAPPAGLSPTVR